MPYALIKRNVRLLSSPISLYPLYPPSRCVPSRSVLSDSRRGETLLFSSGEKTKGNEKRAAPKQEVGASRGDNERSMNDTVEINPPFKS